MRSETAATKPQSEPIGTPAKEPAGTGIRILPICLLLAVATLAVYLPAGRHTFFILDGNDHVTENPYVANGLTGAGIFWAFTTIDAFNWHPITWLSHMAVAQFYGMEPGPHHLANVFIHTAACLLLFLALLRLTGARWRSLFVAALFALHPLHVESVAWVAERKDVLSAFFCFLTLLSYAGYLAKNSRPSMYSLTLVCFIMGLMCKSMLVTLPLLLLIMDFWPLDRYRCGDPATQQTRLSTRPIRLLKEKTPFFACSLVAVILAIYAQHAGGATKGFDAVPMGLRLENALVAYAGYLVKTLWPLDLGVLYPIPASYPVWQVIGSLALLLAISVAVVRSRHSRPYLLAGWLWYLVTLLPVIGLIQVGSQAMADRYMYLPSIGLFIMAAWGFEELAGDLPYRKTALSLLAGAVLIASALLSHLQLGYWKNSVSILRHTAQVTTGNYLVNDMIGVTLGKKGDLDGAIAEFQAALRINPGDPAVHRNLGVVFAEKGRLDEAIEQYRAALQIRPDDAVVQKLLSETLRQRSRFN